MGYCFGLGNYGANFMGGFSWLMPILFFGLVLFGIYYITRSNSNRNIYSALETLNHEYAKGNITREEYLERKRDLQ